MGKDWKYFKDVQAIINILKKYESIVIYDVETTGLNKTKDKIIQFSAIRYKLPEFKEMKRMDIYIKAPFSINGTVASEKNGITDEILDEKGMEEYEAFDLITEFIKEDDLIAGYNNQRFDDSLMKVLYSNYKKEFTYSDNIDVYKFIKWIIPPEDVTVEVIVEKDGKEKKEKKASYTLENVTNYYDPENNIVFHSSINDVEATGYVFHKTLEFAEELITKYLNEEEERSAIPRKDAKVSSIRLFNPSKNLRRVYVNTDQGTVYYDDLTHKWRGKKTGIIDAIDIESVVKQVFTELGIKTESELFAEVQRLDKIKKAKELFGIWKDFTQEKLDNKKEELLKEESDEKEIKKIKSAYNLLIKEYVGKEAA
jgi:DNA polymerase III alpha subunit (gram-positive type)